MADSVVAYSDLLNVLVQYGLRPLEWDGGLIVLRDPNNARVLALSGDPDTPVPSALFEQILEFAGMNEETFWQLHGTI